MSYSKTYDQFFTEKIFTFNQTNFVYEYEDQSLNKFIEIFYIMSKWLNVIFLTLVTLIGLYGNTMSIIIFTSKSFNKSSIKILQIYLVLISISDTLVLLFHYLDFSLRSWVNLIDIHSSKFNFVDKNQFFCKVIPFLRSVFRTISVYSLVLISTQRLVVLYFPIIKSRWSLLEFNKKIIYILVFFSITLNWNNLILNELVLHHNGEYYCSVD